MWISSSRTENSRMTYKAPDVSHAAWAGLDSLDSGIKVKPEVDDDNDFIDSKFLQLIEQL